MLEVCWNQQSWQMSYCIKHALSKPFKDKRVILVYNEASLLLNNFCPLVLLSSEQHSLPLVHQRRNRVCFFHRDNELQYSLAFQQISSLLSSHFTSWSTTTRSFAYLNLKNLLWKSYTDKTKIWMKQWVYISWIYIFVIAFFTFFRVWQIHGYMSRGLSLYVGWKLLAQLSLFPEGYFKL